jgi:predicted CXXCH cytochrome family protein
MLKAILILTSIIGTVPAIAAADEAKESSGYIGSETCGACHADQYNAWKTSKHAVGNNSTDGPEKAAEPTQDWIQNCSGCHTTNRSVREPAWSEMGVGCEACHGPGQEHVSNMGDTGKIVLSREADICGRCHGGNLSGTGLMSDGTKWVVGYRPGMKLSDVPGLQMTSLDPAELPPPPINNHPLIYNMWKASGHAETSGRTFTIGDREWSGPITCVACHNPHQSEHPHQLVMDPHKICDGCHIQAAVVQGKGAKGIQETRSLHTAISCVECHMTEENHLMKVLRPDDPKLAEDRTDTCSSCHEVKDRKRRAKQIQDWEAWYRETMEPVQADMKIVNDALKKNPNLLNAELREKFEDTKANLAIIEQDGSEGDHNLDYALEIMALAKRDLAKIKAAIK